MNSPVVSVTMVTCNVERFLPEAIESILGQTFTDFEFVIVDFGSTDNSKTIVMGFAAKDSRIKFHEISHTGLAEARNAAGFLAQGKYIAIMDADDVAVAERLKWQVDFMEEHPQVALLGGATEWIDSTGRKLHSQTFPATHANILAAFPVHCPFCQPTVLIRREAFSGLGGYRGAFAPAEDYDLWMRLSEHYETANVEQILLHYRVHPYQVSFRKRTKQTLCCLAARVSANARKKNQPDPMTSVDDITPQSLVQMGVSEREQQIAIVGEFLFWLRAMNDAGEHAAALKAAVEFSESSDWPLAEKWQLANLGLIKSRLYWNGKKYGSSILAFGRAFIARPAMLGRPLKSLLRWFAVRRKGTRMSGVTVQ